MSSDEAQESVSAQKADRPNPLAVIAAMAIIALTLYGVYLIYPQHVHTGRNPSFVDNIVDESIVIWGARLALLFAAAYVVVSVIGLMRGQRWLTQVGPFRTDAPGVAELSKEAE